MSLEAHESLESPVKEREKERRKSLRSYSSRKSEGSATLEHLNANNCYINNNFLPIEPESPLPRLPWADNNDVWERMLKREEDYKKDPFYLRRHPSLQIRMRSILLDWLIEVIN